MLTKACLQNNVMGLFTTNNSNYPVYLALFQNATKPSWDGSDVVEVNGTGYARHRINYYTNDLVNISSAEDREAAGLADDELGVWNKTSEIHFNEATGDWGEIKYFGVYYSGSLIYIGELETAIHPGDEGRPSVAVIRPKQLKIVVKSEEYTV